MGFGYKGKILRVNLSNDEVQVETLEENFYRRYFGGRALIAYYLLSEMRPKVDPLDPENKLIFATGILTGAPFSGSGRNSVGALSKTAVDPGQFRRARRTYYMMNGWNEETGAPTREKLEELDAGWVAEKAGINQPSVV